MRAFVIVVAAIIGAYILVNYKYDFRIDCIENSNEKLLVIWYNVYQDDILVTRDYQILYKYDKRRNKK